MHEKLLTNKERMRRHLTDDPRCARCRGEESSCQVLQDCSFATIIWGELKIPSADMNWWNSDIQSWLLRIIKHENSLLLGVTCWYLWKARNELIFDNLIQPAIALVKRICYWTAVARNAMEHKGQSRPSDMTEVSANIAWDPGPSGWMVLNTDESVISPSGAAAAGGLVRDELGRCCLAFSSNVGYCSITRAELRDIATSLKLAWEAGFKKIVVQADSSAAISLINAEGHPSHQHAGEVLTIRELMLRECEVVIYHVYREGNHSADFLANLGHSLSLGTHQVPI
ncbi:Putative ribonuclease H protein At1g65750 [Linum perenne]